MKIFWILWWNSRFAEKIWVFINIFSNDYQKIGSAVSPQCKPNGFRVISLKFVGKSKKIDGVWTSRTCSFRMYGDNLGKADWTGWADHLQLDDTLGTWFQEWVVHASRACFLPNLFNFWAVFRLKSPHSIFKSVQSECIVDVVQWIHKWERKHQVYHFLFCPEVVFVVPLAFGKLESKRQATNKEGIPHQDEFRSWPECVFAEVRVEGGDWVREKIRERQGWVEEDKQENLDVVFQEANRNSWAWIPCLHAPPPDWTGGCHWKYTSW